MVEVQASVDTLSKVASAADEMLRHDPERLAKADKASLRECQRLAVEMDRLLDDAASLIRQSPPPKTSAKPLCGMYSYLLPLNAQT